MAAVRQPTQSAEVIERRVRLAQTMIALGASVFPLAHDSKQPLVPKAAGGHGFLDASGDADRAATFLTNAGQPNYGVVFPEGSDVFVLDIDSGDDHATWREDWQKLYELHGPPGLTFIVKTPSDGRHAYYRWRSDLYGPMPTGDEMLGWTVRKPWKGYLVGPGSVVVGKEYELAGLEQIADFAEAWTRAALAERRGRPGAATVSDGRITIKGPAQVAKGQRHKYLRNQARFLVGMGLSGDALRTAVLDLNSKLPEPKTTEEVERAIGEAETKFEPDELDPETAMRPAYEPDGLDLLPLTSGSAFPSAPPAGAFEGLLGECVADLAGGTDASLVGLLGSLLPLCGALVPGAAYFHRLQTSSPFIALVGESSVGRKGTAMTRASDALADALGVTDVNRVTLDGLASGEGLVSALHYKQSQFPDEPTVGLVFEEEYATLLAARSREGSTLDPKMRAAFDGGPLSNRRSGEHKSVTPPYWLPALIAITPDELRLRLEAGAFLSGSANRWLYLPVRRREVEPTNAAPRLADPLRDALVAARRAALRDRNLPLQVDPGVVSMLTEYADYLPTVSHGLAHELSRRLAVIAFRVALIHALLERAKRITTIYVSRAIALTEYGRASIQWVFGEMLGNRDADLLLRHLAAEGTLSKTAITRGIIRDPIRQQAAIDELLKWGHAEIRVANTTGGRPRRELAFFQPIHAVSSFYTHIRTQAEAQNLGKNGINSVGGLEESWKEAGNKVEERWQKVTPTLTCSDFPRHQTRHEKDGSGQWYCPVCKEDGDDHSS